MEQFVLTDAQWAKMEPHCLGKPTDPGRSGSDNRRGRQPAAADTELYKWRHLIENFFCKLKEFKRIAMRADKTDQAFAAIIHLAAT